MPKVKEKLVKFLIKNNLSIASVESCTGGFFSYLITSIPGASKVFKGGIIAYSLESKNSFFSLSKKVLEKTQGVSKNIAKLLAYRIRKIFKTDIGVSIVGFAGPQDKQTGKIFIGVSFRNRTDVYYTKFTGSRDKIRKQAAYKLVFLLYEKLKGG